MEQRVLPLGYSDGLYRCRRCGLWKVATGFYWRKGKPATSRCRACVVDVTRERLKTDPDVKKRHDAYNRDYQKQPKVRQYHRRKTEKLHDWRLRLKSAPCADCGGTFPPVCMDFDHRDPEAKSFDISHKMGSAYSRAAQAHVEAEIAKCDLVCANCHRIRTWLQGNRRRRRSTETRSVNT